MQIDRVNDLYKLSPVQQDRLAESLSAQSRGSQTRQAIYTLHGQLDHSLFRLAWEQVMSRHSILRTAFYSEGLEKPLQLVEPSSPLTLAEQDWRSLSKDDQEQRLREFLSDDRHQGFNLSRAPLIRLSLLRLSGEVHQFILSYHDLVLDQASVGLVSDEGFAFYGSLCKGENSFDEKAPGSFKEYISWLRQQDSSAAEMFWQDTLTDSESPSALDGFQAWTNRDVSCKQQRTQLSIPASSALQSFARNYRLDITSLLVGAWALLLWRYNDEEHGVLGLMFSGRPSNLPGVDSIAGPFSNTLPARFQVLPEQRLSSWLANLNKWYLEAKQYQHVGPRDLKYSSKPEPGPSLSETVVGEVFAAGIFHPRLSSNGLGIDRLDPFRQSHPLVITALEGPQFSLCISYDEERFADAFIGRTLDQVKMLLETMIAEPEQRLADVSLLTAAERQQLIAECDNHSNGYSRVECVHELFEAQSESTPHATAITFCGQSLSYLQLNERANRLAHHLLALGVGPEAPVGVCLHRSLETVIALLG